MDAGSSLLSVVVMLDGISRQAENTLHTLSPAYQKNVAPSDYDVVVVERPSRDVLGAEAVRALLPAARYLLAAEGESLGATLSLGIHASRAPLVGLLFDGATMVTPRLVEHALLSARVFEKPIAAVPGYQLGKEPQHLHATTGYDERAEIALLSTVEWRRDGHDLFEIACRDPAFQLGFLGPFTELGCVFARRESIEPSLLREAPLDTVGALSMYVFGHLCLLPETKLAVLAGEGTFHQFHQCPSTLDAPARKAAARALRQRLFQHLPPAREPTLLGALPGQSMVQLYAASCDATLYDNICRQHGRPAFPVG